MQFRRYHLLQLLELYEKQKLPLDAFLSKQLRSRKQIGSKDRKFIADTLYGMIRWRGLLDAVCSFPPNWDKRYEAYQKLPLYQKKKLPKHVQVSFPKWYFQQIEKNYNTKKALEICRVSNERAPVTLRINPLKTTRDTLFHRWKGQYEIDLCKQSPLGIHFREKINFFAQKEFKDGFFEIQDEGSQLIADLVQAEPKQWVLDYCAGSGGKTLAFAHRMQKSGQIFLHDIRPGVLKEAKKRLRRAGIENAQILLPNRGKKKKTLKGKMHFVLVDAPCSGSGTLRRNPDMKWKFNEETLNQLLKEQRTIFAEALEYLRDDGKIIYATCSIFKEENQEQVAYFQEKFSIELEKEHFWLPQSEGMDGFYGAVLKKKSPRKKELLVKSYVQISGVQ